MRTTDREQGLKNEFTSPSPMPTSQVEVQNNGISFLLDGVHTFGCDDVSIC